MALRQLASLRGASQKEGKDHHVFVHLSHPDDMRDRSLQTGIRRHVMRDIGRARRKRQRAVIVPLEVELVPEAEADDGRDAPVADALRLRRDRVYWSLDQSGLLGLELDSRALQLVNYMKFEASYKYRACRTIWLHMGLSDPAAFYLSLASAAIFSDAINRGGAVTEFSDHPEAAKYYSETLQRLTTRLNSPSECLRPGVIATVLGFLCHDTHVANWRRWAVHIEGLHRIAKLRGGFEGLDNHIPLLAFWLELVGGTVTRQAPRFSPPREIGGFDNTAATCNPPPALSQLCRRLERYDPELLPVTQALEMMASVAEVVRHSSQSIAFWQDDVGSMRLLGPVTHFILSLPRLARDDAQAQPALAVAEMAKTTCLLLLSGLKGLFALNARDVGPLRKQFLSSLQHDSSSSATGCLLDLKLWSLVTGALLYPSSDDRNTLVSSIGRCLHGKGFNDADALLDWAKSLLWIEVLEDAQADRLGREISAALLTAY